MGPDLVIWSAPSGRQAALFPPVVGTRLPIGCTVGHDPHVNFQSPAVADFIRHAGSFLVRWAVVLLPMFGWIDNAYAPPLLWRR